MKGLLLKDIYLVRKIYWLFAIFTVLWPLMMLAGAPPTVMMFSCMMASFLPMILHSYDERDRWHKYAHTLPLTRDQMITEKYVLLMISVGIPVVISAVCMTVNTLFIREENVLSFGEIAFWCSLYLLFSAASSFYMPFIFRFGAEYGRYIYFAVVILFSFSARFLTGKFKSFENLIAPVLTHPLALAVLILIAAAALLAGSWKLSVSLFRKREL